jgi:hypothetical protein
MSLWPGRAETWQEPDEDAAVIGIDPANSADQLRQSLAVRDRSRASLIGISDVLEEVMEQAA